MGGHHAPGKAFSCTADYVVCAIFLGVVALVATWALTNSEATLEFCQNYLALTPQDVKMIPVGSLLFFLFWKAFEKIVFNPFFELTKAREVATAGATVSAGDSAEKAAELEERYREQLTAARVEATRKKLDTLSLARSNAQKQIDEATVVAKSELARCRADLESQRETLRVEAFKGTDALVDEVISKIKEPLKTTGQNVH